MIQENFQNVNCPVWRVMDLLRSAPCDYLLAGTANLGNVKKAIGPVVTGKCYNRPDKSIMNFAVPSAHPYG